MDGALSVLRFQLRPLARWAWLALLAILDAPLTGVPAYPGTVRLSQADGSRIEARVRGDEFFGWYETLEGHPIQFDADQMVWVYMAENQPRESMTEAAPRVVGQAKAPAEAWTPEEPPEATDLRLSADRMRARIRAGAPTGRVTLREGLSTTGPVEKKLLTICVRFSDSPPASALTPVSYFQEKIYAVTTDPTRPKSTVADYYLEVSGNKLRVTGEAVGWISLPLSTADYGNPSASGAVHDPVRLRALVQNSVVLLGESGFDFGPYDADNDGYLDMLAIVFQGQGEADGGGPQTIWPHQASYEEFWPQFENGEPLNTGDKNAEGEDVFIDLYFTAAELNQSSSDPEGLVRAPIGTFCHEFAHALGLPDLYDRTAPRSAGLGNWSLMATGTYNQADGQAGDSPAWPDPYCRILAGWDQTLNITQNTLRARIPEAKGGERRVHRLWSNGQTGPQYFLMETRKRTGFDRGLPGEGLLVYHVSVNEFTEVAQNDNQWYIRPSASRTNSGHFLVALEQADGAFDLEKSSGEEGRNAGDSTDPFLTGGSFSSDSVPNSRSYPDWGSWGEGPLSHVVIENIDTSSPDVSYADLYVFEDRERPLVNITAPAHLGPVVGEITEATGTAFDNSAITGIRAWIYETGPGGRYYDWNSGTWRPDFAETTQKQLAVNTGWTLAMPALPDGTYRLTVAAEDATGLESAWAVAEFTIDGELLNPELSINSPAGETYAEPPLIQGTASTPAQTTLTGRRFALYSEDLGQWYNWTTGVFDSDGFGFADHAAVVNSAATAWNYVLPSGLGNGRYQIHAQSLNERGRSSPWKSASFGIVRTPTATVTSIAHQSLLPAIGTLSGTAQPQGSYQLQEIRIVLYRNGRYWNGSTWTDTQTFVTAAVPPEGGNWSYSGSLPAEDGLYALSVSALDDQGSLSAAVAGGNAGQNNLIFRVDGTPPSIVIQWPSVDLVLTDQRVRAADLTGTAVDGSGRPVVRMHLKRLGDEAFWSPYGWAYYDAPVWYPGTFPGEDGGSQVQWIMEAELPGAGLRSDWCFTNGAYELTVEARDVVGNVATAVRSFTVDYTDPLMANAPALTRLAPQEPIGPTGADIGSTLLASPSIGSQSDPAEIHSIEPIPSNRYGVVGSRINQSLLYGFSAREPVLLALDGSSLLWQRHLSGPVTAAGGVQYERVGAPPIAAFGTDAAALVVSGLMRWISSGSTYSSTDQCEVVRIAPDGTVAWTRVVPEAAQTAWPGGADRSFLDPKRVRLLSDGTALVVLELNAHDRRQYLGYSEYYQTNFRTHVLLMSIDASGALRWLQRYGVESEDELQHINEFFRFMEPDHHGHVFLATRRTIGGSAPEQVLRKIRLVDGLTVSDHVVDACLSAESWGALTVDATGRPILAGARQIDQNEARLIVKRLSANELIPDWQTIGPAWSAYYDESWGSASEVPLLRLGGDGVTIVHNSPGENNRFGSDVSSVDSNDRLLVTRLDPEGGHLWTREVNVPDAISASEGSRAEFAALTTEGDTLVVGTFASGGSNSIHGYAKVAANGDYQSFKDLADIFDLSYPSFLETSLAATGDRLAALHLRPADNVLRLRTLDNPANVVTAPTWISYLPEDVSAAIGDSFRLEVFNTGSLATFQWYRDVGSGVFEAISGANASHYAVAAAAIGDAGRYRVVATNSAGETTSREATVTVATSAPVITSSLTASSYTNDYFIYQISATEAPLTYTITFDPDNYPSGLVANAGGSISGFPTVAGTFSIQISATNGFGTDARVLVLTVTDRPVITLGQALDAPTLAWTSADPPSEWRVQDFYTQVGTHALVSTPPSSGSSWIEVSLTGPGTLSFWWHAFVVSGASDRLVLTLDGVELASINTYGYVQGSLEIPTGAHTVRWVMESGDTGDYSAGYLDGVSFVASGTGFAAWAAQYGLSGTGALPGANPSGDGIANLLKYAFGLDPNVGQSGSGRFLTPGTGTSGLPDVRPDGHGSEARLQVEFLRRKGSPGIRYAVQFAGDLSLQSWQEATATPVVTSIDAEWERVVVQDTLTLSQGRRRFARVEVTEAP